MELNTELLLKKLHNNEVLIHELISKLEEADKKREEIMHLKVKELNDDQIKKLKVPFTINQIFTIVSGLIAVITFIFNFIRF